MIPILYDKTEAIKIGFLTDCIKCEVLEERNGEFELTLVYPSNSELLEGLEKENIIISDANDYLKNQKFRIYNTRKLMSNRIEVRARHISFDLAHDWIDTISIDKQSCEYVLNTIFRNSQYSTHYRGYSDIVMTADYRMNKANCIEAIGGKTGSILDTFGNGAEILRDNTEIHVLNKRGHDNEVSIEYRKNLTGLTAEEDTTDLVTRIRPYATITDSEGNEIETMGNFVDSPLITNYAHPYVKYIDYSSEFDEDNLPTLEKLHTLATKEYTVNKIDIPKLNYKIEFVPLSKCAGYEGLEDRINLCDTVTIRDTRYNIDTQAKVIKVVYNVLRDRYDKMELGEPRTTLGDVIGGSNTTIQGPPGPPGPQGPAGADGSIEDFPNTLPSTPVITSKLYGFASVELSWTFENKVYYSYELYGSKTKGFTPNTFNLIFSGQASTFLHQVKPDETWYYRVCAVNSHGQRTQFSEECEVKTIKIDDLSNYVETAAIGDVLIGTLSLDRGWVGQLKGSWIDAKQLSVTDGNGKRTLDIDSFGNVNLNVTSLKINSNDVISREQTETLIEAKAGEISLSVAKNEVNNLQIGGANLLLNSDAKKQLDRAESGRYNQIFYTLVDDYVGLTLNNDTTFVLSFMVDRTGNTEFECFDTITFDNGWAHRWTRSDIDKITLIQGSTYKFVMKPKTLPKGTTIADKLYFIAENYCGGGLFYKLMLTEGEKAFDWQPAFKDIEASIARIDVKSDEINLSVNRVTENLSNNYPTTTQMNSAIQLKADSITSTVNANYTTLNNKFNNYPTTTQMNSAITQKANEITSSVSQTYATKGEVSENYATKSELTQTSNSITAIFSDSSGGGNLVANGDFLNGRDNWWVWGDTHYYLDSIPDCSTGARMGSNSAGGFVSNQFRIKPNTKYTFSFDGYIEPNVISATVYLEMFDGNGNNMGVAFAHSIERTNTKYTHQFTTGNFSPDWFGQIMFKHEGSNVINGGYLMVVNNVCLTEGYNSGQFVPATRVLYEGVLRADKTGLKVTHSSDSSYSHMGANGFEFYSHGSGHRYHNLMKQGWIDTISFGGIGANGWSTTITLPPEFRNKPFSVIPAITYVGCPHIADAVKMFEINIPHGEVNYANGTFRMYIYASGLWAEGLSTTYSVQVRATWVAIA